MMLQNPSNGEPFTRVQARISNEAGPSHDEPSDEPQAQRLSEDVDSACSTPYVSAPSSPSRGPTGYYYSAPASPMHFVLTSGRSIVAEPGFLASSSEASESGAGSFEFEFSSRFSPNGLAVAGSMSSADELFLNGKIRPMKLSTHLQRPQILAPLMDLDGEEEDEEGKALKDDECEKCEASVMRGRDLKLRNRSMHRKTRSLSPLRNAPHQWREDDDDEGREAGERVSELEDSENGKQSDAPSTETTPSVSASSSRSSSSGRNSKKWIFLKDLLYRSKSEGRENSKDKFWSFSPAKEKILSSSLYPSLSFSFSKPDKDRDKEKAPKSTSPSEQQDEKKSKRVKPKKAAAGKPANGVGKRRVPPSPHELHYTTNRAQAEEMKKKTFLPYRQGLFGCLSFSSKGYGALNGFTRTLNPVPSR